MIIFVVIINRWTPKLPRCAKAISGVLQPAGGGLGPFESSHEFSASRLEGGHAFIDCDQQLEQFSVTADIAGDPKKPLVVHGVSGTVMKPSILGRFSNEYGDSKPWETWFVFRVVLASLNVVALVSSNGRQREALSTTQQLGFSSRWRKLGPISDAAYDALLQAYSDQMAVLVGGLDFWTAGDHELARWGGQTATHNMPCSSKNDQERWFWQIGSCPRATLQMGETYCNCGIMTWLFNAVYISVVSSSINLDRNHGFSWSFCHHPQL